MEQPGFIGAVSRFWQRSYAADYISFVLLLVAYILTQKFLEPFHRMFSLDNIAIQYPHAEVERVSSTMLMVYSAAVPLSIMSVWAGLFRPGLHKVHVTILGLLISLVLTAFLTNVVKNSVGRPRPDLIARCKPAKGTPEHILVTIDVCTETEHHTLHDGWRSFPSGHSSSAFSGLGYLALFLAGQMLVFRPRTDLARVLLALAPIIGAALIAISRCEDYRHDVYDVTIGSLLGMSIAYFSYKRYYPGLKSAECDTPYPSRADVDSMKGFGKLKDEEERIQSAAEFSIDDLEDDVENVPLADARRDRSRTVEGSDGS